MHSHVKVKPWQADWRYRAALLLLGVWSLVLPTAGEQAGPKVTPEEVGTGFRVMTYNIHHGEGVDGRVDLGRIADVIKKERVDLVALQEVDKGVERTARRDFPAELAALTGMSCVFSNNFYYQGGEYGNAVLSRFPELGWTNTHLQMLRIGEQRGILQVTVKAHERTLVFMATHIDYRRDDAERLVNVSQFKRIAKTYAATPLLICGDFNDTPESRTYRSMSEDFVDVWNRVGDGPGFTITSSNPTKRIDYVWQRKDEHRLVPAGAWVVQTTASDHLPLVVELRWGD